MKVVRNIVAVCTLFLLIACENKTTSANYSSPNLPKIYKSWEIDNNVNRDTINIIDADGLKQGLWIERDKDKSPYTNDIDTFTYKDGIVLKNNK